MIPPPIPRAVATLILTAFLPGCALLQNPLPTRPTPQTLHAKDQHTAFRSQPGWRKQTYRNEDILRQATPTNTALEIALREQRGLLLVNKAIAMDFPVATGRPSHPTPKGSFKILEKKKDYASNLYGRIEDAEGTVLLAEADTRTDAIPEGAHFVGSTMPCWMRISPDGIGLHIGRVPGNRPVSHGCIRLERNAATQLFALLPTGTPVTIAPFAPTLNGPIGLHSIVTPE